MEQTKLPWREIDTAKPATTIGPALRAIAGAPGKAAAEIRNALSSGSGAAGGFTLPEDMHDELVAATSRAMSAVQAGARVIQLAHDDLTVPRVLGGVTPAWRLESAAVAESDPTFEAAKLTPRSLSIIVKVSRELLADGFEIENALVQTLASGVAEELDRACYRGTGTAPEPLGLFNRPLLTLAGEVDTPLENWRPINDALWGLQTGTKYPVRPSALVAGFRMLGEMEALSGSDGQLRSPPRSLAALPRIASSGMGPAAGDPLNCYAAVIGDFRQMLIGWRGEMRVELLRELYAGTGQVAFLVHCRVGFELLNRFGFVVLRRLKLGLIVR